MKYQTLKEIADEYGLKYITVYRRFRRSDSVKYDRVGNTIRIEEGSVHLLTGTIIRHGFADTPHYSRWTSLLHNHRGEVPDSWKDFASFLGEVGEPPGETARLCRKDPAQPWSKANAEWKTA